MHHQRPYPRQDQARDLLLAERLAQGPTLAYGFAKAAVYESANRPLESLLDFEARNQKTASRSEDAKEGVRSFLERRKPEFRGR